MPQFNARKCLTKFSNTSLASARYRSRFRNTCRTRSGSDGMLQFNERKCLTKFSNMCLASARYRSRFRNTAEPGAVATGCCNSTRASLTKFSNTSLASDGMLQFNARKCLTKFPNTSLASTGCCKSMALKLMRISNMCLASARYRSRFAKRRGSAIRAEPGAVARQLNFAIRL